MRVVALSAGALATLAGVGGLAVLNGNDSGADKDSTEAVLASHRGMVEGTVWIANEGAVRSRRSMPPPTRSSPPSPASRDHTTCRCLPTVRRCGR